MNATVQDPRTVQAPAQALLDLIEADRARQVAQITGEARSRADAQRAQSRAESLARLRQAFDEQRKRRDEALAAAQARLATQRRLHGQQRVAALLQLAWQRLPLELSGLWKQPEARAAWVAQTVASARLRLPPGTWRVQHAAGWPEAEQQACAAELAAISGAAPQFQADAAIAAGLKIGVDGNVIDGTLAGLLADRAAIEARLLRLLETTS